MEAVDNQFKTITLEYIRDLKSLFDSMPLVSRFFRSQLSSNVDKYNSYLDKYNIQIDENNKILNASYRLRFVLKRYEHNIAKIITVNNLYFQNAIVSFVCSYDAFLSQIIKLIYRSNEQLLKASEKLFTYTQIAKYKDFEELKDALIEKEIENILRENHNEQFKKISKLLNKPIVEGENCISDFIEITERRNLFVHSGGKVSEQYLKACKDYNYNSSVKIGDVLQADTQYITNAFFVFLTFGIKLSQVIWRIIGDETSLEQADRFLVDVTFDLLCENRFDIAKNLLDFATEKSTKHKDKEVEYIHSINKALCFYLNGEKNESDKIVQSIDFSAANDRFLLAKYVLLEKYEEAVKYVERLKNEVGMQDAYGTWPLFRNFVQQDVFKKTYKNVYGDDFEYFEHEDATWSEIIATANSIIKEKKWV